MRNLLYAATALVAVTAIPTAANAANILNFSQAIAGLDTITATANSPAAGQTSISTVGFVGVSVSCITCGALVSPNVVLHATSLPGSHATVDGSGNITQAFSGTFDIFSGALSVLHAVFTDAIFGSGSSLTLSVSNTTPGESLSFTSDIIPANLLGNPLGLSLSFADVTPPADTTPLGCSGIAGCTIDSFVSSVSGTASANPIRTPEPASLALMGVGLLGLGFVAKRKRRG